MAADENEDSISSYRNVAEARNRLREDFNYWTGELGRRALELSFGIIGASWAFASTNLQSDGSCLIILFSLSILVALIYVWVNLFNTHRMKNLYLERYVESHEVEFEREFEARTTTHKEFPYNKKIQDLGKQIGYFRFWMPTISSFLFLLAIVPKLIIMIFKS